MAYKVLQGNLSHSQKNYATAKSMRAKKNYEVTNWDTNGM